MAYAKSVIAQAIKEQSVKHGLQPDLVAAIVFEESQGDPFAIRKEEGFFDKYMKGKTLEQLGGFAPPEYKCTRKTEISARYHSWGLMQVMGQVAREMGLKSTFISALIDPSLGIHYGCKKFRKCLDDNDNDIERAATCYNGSSSYFGKIKGHINSGAYKVILFP